MSVAKNLSEVSKEEQRKFINSFDIVVCDLDGVIWLNHILISGVPECIKNLKKLEKTVHYVSNNGVTTIEDMFTTLSKGNIELTQDDIVVPSETTAYYLKKLNFKKDIFVLCMEPMRNELKKNGFNVLPDPPLSSVDDVNSLISHNEDHSNVGAVIVDNDFNTNYLKLQKAFWYLRNPDCLFLITHQDKCAPFGPKGPLLGPYYFAEALKDLTGKDYVRMGKPSQICVDYFKEKFNIRQNKRVLFVGDSILSDLQTGAMGGFQKLLVLSGNTKLEDLKNWNHPEEFKPDYYVQDLGVLNEIIESNFSEL